MKIKSVKTFVIDCFRTNWVFVKVETDEGISGIGEGTLEYKENALSAEFMKKIEDSCQAVIYASAKDGVGLSELERELEKMYRLGEINLSNDAVIANARQFAATETALERALEAKGALNLGETPDIICFSLESALSELNMIDRREVSEEVVSAIFSRFCVGK